MGPNDPDSEKVINERLFSLVVIGALVIFTFEFIFLFMVLPQNLTRWITTACIFDSVGLFTIFLNKKGQKTFSSSLFIMLIITVVYSMALTAGGMRASALQVLPVIVLISGVLLGWKNGLWTTFVIIVLSSILLIVEYAGLLPVNKVHNTPLSLFIDSTIIISMVAFLQYLAVSNLHKALAETKQELTNRILLEKELQTSENFRKTIFESSRVPIVIMDSKTHNYIDCNQAAVDIYRYHNFQEVIGKKLLDFSASVQYDGTPSAEKAEFYINKVLTEGSVVFEWKHLRNNGEYWDAEVYLMSFYLDDVQFIQFTLTDITARKETETLLRERNNEIEAQNEEYEQLNEELNQTNQELLASKEKAEESEARYRSLYENVPVGLYRTESNGHVLDTNLASIEMLGYKDRDELMAITSSGLWVNPEQRVPLTQLTPFDPNYDLECQMYKKDKSIIWIRNRGHAVFNNQGQILYYEGSNEDITERKKTEVRFQTLIEVAPIGICIVTGGKFEYVNKAYEVITGYSADELLSMDVYDLVIPEMRQKLIERNQKRVEGKNVKKTYEISGIRKDSMPYNALITSDIIDYKDQIATIAFQQDITEFKKAEQALMESERRFKEISDLLPQVIFECDITGKLTYVNKIAYEIFGYSPEDVNANLEITRMIIPEERNFALERFDNTLKNRSPQHTEYTALKKDGSRFPVMTYSNNILHNNETVGLRGVIFDISEIRQAEKTIKESEERYRIVTNLSGNMIFEHLLPEDVIIWGGAIENVTGYKPEEYKHNTYANWMEMIHSEDKEITIKLLEEAISSSKPYHAEYRIQNKNKELIWVEADAYIVTNEHNQVVKVFGVMKNITDRKRLEAQILNSIIETEEKERLYFSQELHDGLGPLLSSIKMFIQWLGMPDSKLESAVILQRLEKLIDESTRTVRDISFKLSPHILQNYGLGEALKAYSDQVQATSQIVIYLNVEALSRFNEMKETIIYRVLCECVNNTIKHAQASTIKIDIKCQCEVLYIEYSDDGKGFDLDKITLNHKGLGLSNMRSRIKSINGQMLIYSSIKNGTNIKFQINIS